MKSLHWYGTVHKHLIRELKKRRFWMTHVNRKWAFFSFNILWRYQMCLAKYLYFYWDELPENLGKIAAQ